MSMRGGQANKKSNQGISLIEVLISMAILAAGVMAYAKLQSSLLTSGQDNLERQQAALIAADTNTILAAHVNEEGFDASRQQVKDRITTLEQQLELEAKRIAEQRGYRCENNVPVLNVKSALNTLSASSVFQSWVRGPAFCLEIHIPGDQQVNPDFNGVWVQTTVHWLPLKRSDHSTDRITVSGLIAPM